MAQTHQAVKRQEATQIAECNLMGIAHTRMSIRLTPCPGVTRETPLSPLGVTRERLDPPDVSAPKGAPGGWGRGRGCRCRARPGTDPSDSGGQVATGTWFSPVRPVRRPLRPGNGRREGQSATPLTPPRRGLFSGGQCPSRRQALNKRRSGEASCLGTSLAPWAECNATCNKRNAGHPRRKRAPGIYS